MKKIFGNSYSNSILGSAAHEYIDAGVGNDRLYGYGGNDVLRGNRGNDLLEGGIGNDSLFGQDNNDTLRAADGNDLLDGGTGHDLIYGGDGHDRLRGDYGNDYLDAGNGNDAVYGGQGADFIRGGEGNDALFGNLGNYSTRSDVAGDTIHGDGGHDRIRDFFKATIFGGDGNDTIINGRYLIGRQYSYGNENTIHGDDGNDYIIGGADSLVYGDAGNDRIFISEGSWAFGGSGDDRIVADGSGRVLLDGGDGNDWLDVSRDFGAPATRSDWANDILRGGAGNDTLHGGGGDDELTGGSGADVFVFTPVADYSNPLLHAGATTGRYNQPDFHAVITDFEANIDRISLGAIFTVNGWRNGDPIIGTRALNHADIRDMLGCATSTTVNGRSATVLHMPGFDDSTITLVGVHISQLDVNDFTC